MPLLGENRTDSGASGGTAFGGDSINTRDDMAIGFWWSNADFQWWPVYLWEVREASGNATLDAATARKWWEVNYDGSLRLSVPRDGGTTDSGGTPVSTRYQYDFSGRTEEKPRGGSGRGSGAAPAVYRAPDADSVREQIKMYVVATTGTANQGLIDRALSEYMSGDKEAFDRSVADKGDQIDPFNRVKDVVRGSAEYKQIHQLRPESVDELDWVTSRQGKLYSLGLSAERAEALGVKQATVGANDEALIGAAEMQFNADTGRMLSSQRDALKRAGSAAMGLL